MVILVLLQLFIAIKAFTHSDLLHEEGKHFFDILWENKDGQEITKSQINAFQELVT